MKSLTILYDGTCALCVRCRDFLAASATYVPFELLSSQSPGARERFGDVPWLGEELVVVSDEGDVWIGPAAFLVCLWALREWREWSYRLSGETLAPLAERFFVALSSNRRSIAKVLGPVRCTPGDHGSCEADVIPHSRRPVYR
jgi:predicted DCC family thiol-disulfide oxidoreductase YuxK